MLWRKIEGSDTAIEVNLDAPPRLPFGEAQVEWTTPGQTGWVRVEKKDSQLFVDGRKVNLHLTYEQKNGHAKGYVLRRRLEDRTVLHPNILDALLENPHLFPDSWKVDGQGLTIFVYFWAVGYCNSVDHLFVRCVYFRGAQWRRRHRWLGLHWGGRSPAAVSAS